MNYPKTKRTLMSLAVAGTFTSIVVPGYAQDAAAAAQADTTAGAVNTPEANAATVVVSGIRRSLETSMNLKRNSNGVVDGIVAEDIGKFPDQNLAESLQRISGVSIDRTSSGEGSKVTVRGIGPDYNLVLLNGRQMPTSNFDGLIAPKSRSFDFANLASEAISQIQVYKTGRADTPTGGIGATINVMTARPLDNPGLHASVGVKVVDDTSFKREPSDIKHGSTLTPEFSGIFSDTFHDKMFGVALSASVQERNSGYNTAGIDAGYLTNKGYTPGWGSVPTPSDANYATQDNRPGPNDVYMVPLSASYSMNSVQRKRTNGQAVFQFAPTKDLKTTLDYTYAQNKVTTRTASLGAWMAVGGNGVEWSNGPVASPVIYDERYALSQDITASGSYTKTKTQLGSVGFNAQWRASDRLKLELDAHHSVSETKPDSPYGFNNSLGVSSYTRNGDSIDFTEDMPVLTIYGEDFTVSPPRVSGSSFRNALQRMEINQYQAKGSLDVWESSSVDFGLALTNVKNRSAFSDNQNGAWGAPGASSNISYAPDTWHYDDLRQYFNAFNASTDPKLSSRFVTFDFDNVINQISDANHTNNPALYQMNPNFTTDQRTEEKSKSLYAQLQTDWDTALPLHTAVGLRYEKTDVTSSALVPIATGLFWKAPNEFNVIQGAPNFTTLTGAYNYLLPNVDAALDLTKDSKLRGSYSESIGRPAWNEIQGGQTLDILARVNGGTGTQGNPDLKPVKSKNLDLSYEWYYGKQSYLSAGFFRKNLRNYTGSAIIQGTPFNLHTPVGGALWNEAISTGGCASGDSGCIYNWILANRGSSPGVDTTANTITGQPGDPIANFNITTSVNKESAGINGVELNMQHMFGNTGFGFSANYTYVQSDLKFDNYSLAQQFVLPGLSNSSNLVGIYEDAKWSVRAAYNWRGSFYNGVTGNGVPLNPIYVDPYGQWDLSVGYNVTPQLSVQFEGINISNSTQRAHSRTDMAVVSVTQTGPRYSLGARYKF